ncbi:ABC-2 transporter permease [Clostridium paridis]|uniref:ABC-2 transporter permease n=1 Tax=Clostridium paridis TaxID=2803863 RepID=A0A937FIN1_9CLOT|nr:ABC-2 transporter permease [Clostridium paridis]MBL4932838.1 ABC-2 transporter permease [Clostridium paridis]
MKDLVLNYFKMIRAGFFYRTFLLSLWLIIPSILNIVVEGTNLASVFIVCMVAFIILPGIMEESIEGYIFYAAIPIRTKDIVKYMYVNTYIIFIIGLVMHLIFSYIANKPLSMLYIISIGMMLLITNVFYPFYPIGGNTDTIFINEKLISFKSVVIISLFVATFLLEIIFNSSLNKGSIVIFQWILMIVILLITIGTAKISYRATIKRIME